MAIDSETTTPARRSARIGSTRRVIGLLAVLAVLAIVGSIVVPVALPSLASAMNRNPYVPLLVAVCWTLATTASITGKRAIAAGYLNWADTATAHVGGTVANRVVPAGVGAAGVFVAALHRGGASTKAAAGVVALWAVAGGLAHAGGLLLGVAWLREGGQGVLAVVVVVVVVVVGIRLIVRWAMQRAGRTARPGRERTRPVRTAGSGRVRCLLTSAIGTLRDVVTAVRARPMLALAALAAQLTATVCIAAGFALAAVGLGVPVSFGVGMAAYLAGTALSAATPTPGGIGSAETALVGALMLAGASVSEALPTVLVFRAVILLAPVVAAAAIAAAWVTRRLVKEARERVRRRQLAVRAALPLAIEAALPHGIEVTFPLTIEPAAADGLSP